MVKDSHTGRRIAVGALVAGAVGYVAGILTAPKSGKETREDVANKVTDVKEETLDQLQNLHTQLDDLIKKTKDKSLGLSSQAREEFNEAVVKAKDAKDKTGTLLKSVKKGEAEDPELNKAIKQAKAAIRNLAKYFGS
jgi:gas vesicle protein